MAQLGPRISERLPAFVSSPWGATGTPGGGSFANLNFATTIIHASKHAVERPPVAADTHRARATLILAVADAPIAVRIEIFSGWRLTLIATDATYCVWHTDPR